MTPVILSISVANFATTIKFAVFSRYHFCVILVKRMAIYAMSFS